GLAWAMVVSSFVSFYFNAYFVGRYPDYGAWRHIRDLMSSIDCSAVTAVAVAVLGRSVDLAAPIQLFAMAGTGIVVYLLMARIFRLEQLDEGMRFFRTIFIRPAATQIDRCHKTSALVK